MPSNNIVDFAYQVRDYMRGAEVVEGKNLAYSQDNNAVIATIENGKSYKVRWTGSATVTLKKNSASGTEVTSGSTSPLSFTADSDFDLYFGSSADVTEIMVYDGNETSDTYEPYYVPVKDRVDELENDVLPIPNLVNNVNLLASTLYRFSLGNQAKTKLIIHNAKYRTIFMFVTTNAMAQYALFLTGRNYDDTPLSKILFNNGFTVGTNIIFESEGETDLVIKFPSASGGCLGILLNCYSNISIETGTYT